MKKKHVIGGKAIALLIAVVLVVGGVVGGMVAWLVDNTDTITNTFTYGDINIDLTETTGIDYKILPGNDIEKDPMVTVKAGSEPSWLFVKIDESNWPTFTETDGTTLKVSYAVATGWTALTGSPGVYYREVGYVFVDTNFYVLNNNTITVSENLNKAEVNTVVATQPTLTFKAYAVQRDAGIDAIDTAAEAWTKVTP